jgi:hypothetical protein
MRKKGRRPARGWEGSWKRLGKKQEEEVGEEAGKEAATEPGPETLASRSLGCALLSFPSFGFA